MSGTTLEAYRLLVEGVRDYALLVLDTTGTVMTWNAGAERIKGYRPEEIIGRHFSAFYTPEDIADGKPERALAEAVSTGRYEEEGQRVRQDGTRFWASVVLTALYDEGRLFGFGKVTRDVTERHLQRERLDEAAAELADANRSLLAQAVELSEARDAATSAVHRQEFGRRLANALDMVDGEGEALQVVERAMATVLPGYPAELLLADHSHAHLERMATASPTGAAPGCGVEAPDRCPAARRAQIQIFSDSEALDACPKLRGRGGGGLSAVCVPVSMMGRTVGVIHATAGPGTEVAPEALSDLATLANQAGARIGLLRVMSETQLQATTDTLTGLLNRRTFEERVAAGRRPGTPLSVVMIDLDHFKALNDTYGHEAGDRALRLFAQVAGDSIRNGDVLGRHGGEEFALALPGCAGAKAQEICTAVAVRLAAAIVVAGAPGFTASFGIVEAADGEDLPAALARADSALFEAKRSGRDRSVRHDARGATVVDGTPDPDSTVLRLRPV